MTSPTFQVKNKKWMIISVIAGVVAGLISYFVLYNWIISLIVFCVVSAVVLYFNPNRLFLRAFYSFLALTIGSSSLIYFDVSGELFGVSFHVKSDTQNPSILFGICGMISLVLFFLERNDVIDKLFLSKKVAKNDFQTFIDQIEKNGECSVHLEVDSLQRFWYRADLFSFVGRINELKQLEDFCKHDNKILWYAITGRGGQGKSRLAYEFVKRSKTDWKMHFLDWSDFLEFGCADFEHYDYNSNLLVVIDYVSKDAESIGKWLKKVCSLGNRKFKLRVLFLQREGLTRNKIGELNYPVWYERLVQGAESSDIVRNVLFKSTFLTLPKLSAQNLKQIIVNYIVRNDANSPTEEEQERLIQSLKDIDSDFQRPIYALFLADAWLENSDKVLDWSIKNLQEWLNYHEIKKIDLAFRGKNKDQNSNALKYILALATALEKIDVTSLEAKPFEDSVERLRKYSEAQCIPLANLIRSFDLNAETEEEGIILHGIVPDIMGEYFCLTYLKRLYDSNDSARLDAFIQTAWKSQNISQFRSFLIRCINDFQDHKMTRWLLDRVPKEIQAIENYSDVLRYLSSKQDLEKAEITLELVKKLYDVHQSSKILTAYAKGMSRLTIHQNEEQTIETVDKLEQITKDHPDNEIFVEYAKALSNLSVEQGFKDSTESIEKIRQLSECYPLEEVIIQYAKALFASSLKTESSDLREKNFSILQKLQEQHQSQALDKIVSILQKSTRSK